MIRKVNNVNVKTDTQIKSAIYEILDLKLFTTITYLYNTLVLKNINLEN